LPQAKIFRLKGVYMRKKVIAGNWKMYHSPKRAAAFVNEIKASIDSDVHEVVLCVPYVDIEAVQEALQDTNIKVGAQNMHYKDEGACTGEISGLMLKEMGVPYVIIGHSERRANWGETDTSVNLKVVKALEHGLVPIICVGENLKQRKDNITSDLLRRQTTIALIGLTAEEASRVVIAYEPIWAIGTGETATDEQAEEACAYLREVVKANFGENTAETIRILYGGSVNDGNASQLFAMPNIDGGLVGGASLKPSFERIVHFE
jgi:triosephosphate isomerase